MPATSDLVKEARQRWLRCAEAEDSQRKRILKAKQFRAGDQWPEEIKIQRLGGSALQGQAAQPQRPMLTIDRLSQPVRQVSNQIASANFGLDVLPNGSGADAETAKIFKGIIRRMQNEARTTDPIGWAGMQAIEGGLGWFRLRAEYIEPLPGSEQSRSLFDQELRLERIANNLSVYCDDSATLPTRRDALFLFVTEDMPTAEFKRLYPKARIATLDEFSAEGDHSRMRDWIGKDTIRVAEYWRIVFSPRTFVLLDDGSVVEMTDKTPAIPKDRIKNERKVQVPKVEGYKISAVEQLESWDWLGTRIPIFPILGEELNLDGRQLLRGIIEEGMDAQRMVNYTYSGAIEIFALAPKSPWVVAEGQTEGYEAQWQNANRFNFSTLTYRPISLAGTPVPPPTREVQEPPIQAAVMLMQKSEEGIRATTGLFEPSLGAIDPKQRSGRAILALQQQGELGSSNYMDSVQRAWLEVGQEILVILPQLTRPGQVLQILGVDDAPEQVMVGQPYQLKDGQPQPVNIPPELVNVKQGLQKFYDLSKGRYAVTVNVGKQYTTRKQEGASMLGDMLEKNPQLLQVFGDIFFRDLDFPGSEEVSERMKKMLPPQLQQGQDGQPNPQQIMQQAQQLQVLVKHLTDELNAKNKVIEEETVKAQRDVQLEQAKQGAETQRLQMELSAKERLEIIKAESNVAAAEVKAGLVQVQAQIDQINAAFEHVLSSGHEAVTQARDHAQEQELQAREHAHEQQMAQQQQAHEQDLASQQAEMAQQAEPAPSSA